MLLHTAAPRLLTREDILRAPTGAEELLDIPELGGQVRLRPITLAGRDAAITAATVDGKRNDSLLAVHLFIAMCVEPQLTPDQETVQAMRAWKATTWTRLATEMGRINGLTEEAAKETERTFPVDV